MNPLRWLLAPLIDGFREGARRIEAAERFADLGTDDDLMAVADAVQDECGDPCDDPNVHALAGCQPCVEELVIIAALSFDQTLDELLSEGQR